MQSHAKHSQTLKNISHIARAIMGLVFIVSGFVKVIDPWGTYIKVDEYLLIYGLESLMPYSMYFSIWLCSAELIMGNMLFFKVRIRFVSICALISMTIFTIITLLSATILPVEDCGCFGEAIKLTPWQTFFKNLSLLPLAFIVWWRYRPDKIFQFNRLELLLAATFFSVSLGLGIYCYRHLPLIDFLPYKVGLNLAEAIKETENYESDHFETVLVYKNRRTGKVKEFKIDDTVWQDDSKWEWVETRTISEVPSIRPIVSEFALRHSDGEICTDEILGTDGILNMIFITSFSDLDGDGECADPILKFIEEADKKGEKTICVTPEYIYEGKHFLGLECYNIDPTTMKTVLRARDGLMRLDNGIIIRKSNCRDI